MKCKQFKSVITSYSIHYTKLYDTYEPQQNYMNYAAIVPTQIQLDELKWESISSVDLGLEMNLFDYRLYVEADVYRKLTSDLLFQDS